MRVDAKALLDRLGKSDFSYKEFADRFSELELWPLFEALLKDSRLGGLDERVAAAPAAGEEAGVQPASRQGDHASFATLFGRYEQAASKGEAQPQGNGLPQDVRTLLRQLSELSAKGDL